MWLEGGTISDQSEWDSVSPVLNRRSWWGEIGGISQSRRRGSSTKMGLCNASPTAQRLLLPVPLVL